MKKNKQTKTIESIGSSIEKKDLKPSDLGVNEEVAMKSEETSEEYSEEYLPGSNEEPPADKVFSIIPAEMRFGALVSQNPSEAKAVDCVLDTGCGAGYLVGSNPGLSTHPVCYRVEMADGSKTVVQEAASVYLTVGSQTEIVQLRILPSPVNPPFVLFGRELIDLFGIGTHGCQVLVNGRRLQDSARMLAEYVTEDHLERKELSELPLPTGVSSAEKPRVEFSLTRQGARQVTQVLHDLIGEARELQFCSGAVMNLRRLESPARKDTREQELFFELSLPPPEQAEGGKGLSTNRLYSSAIYSKLSTEHKKEFDELVEAYVKSGWWEETQSKECGNFAANVFPVMAPGRKMRLVSDFRPLNRFYPASTKLPRIYHPLLLLRLFESENLIVADCKAAFYRVRLKEPVWLHAGQKTYLCNRMAFGLSMGPEGLRNSLGRLWQLWKEKLATAPGYSGLFVDDFFLTNSADTPKLFHLLGLCGFEVPVEKFQQAQADTRLLGITLRRRANTMSLICEDKEQQIRDTVATCRKKCTKQNIFALAGTIGYDAAHLHPERRLVADLLRGVVGKYKDGWQVQLLLTEIDQCSLNELLRWLEELLERPACNHITTPGKSELYLRLETDASKFGYGIVIKHKPTESAVWTVVYQDASVWKASQRNHHVNRQEGFALMIGLRIVASFIEFAREATTGNMKFSSFVEVATDSTTALSWARTGESLAALSFKSVERRQILMLAEALHSELTALEKCSTAVRLFHIQGESNTEADGLSRLLYRQIPGGKTLGAILAKEPIAPDDGIARVHEKQENSLVLLASTCVDLTQLLEKLAWFGASLGGRSESTDIFAFESLARFARACQRVARPGNIKQFILVDDVYMHEEMKFTGELAKKFVIPSNDKLERVRELILRFYHKRNRHRGRKYDIAFMHNSSPFFLEGITKSVALMNARCLLCARKNAIARAPVGAPPQVIQRAITLPPFSRVSIDFVHHRSNTILSAVCTDTGVSFLTPVEGATAMGAMNGLRRLSRVYCVNLRRVHSDNAQAFSKAFQAEARKEWAGIEFSFRVAYLSNQNPVERMHREMWSVVKARKFSKALDEDDVTINQDTLEEVGAILNLRPLGVLPSGEVVTPALLAWGANHSQGSNKLTEVRRYFYENIFALQRRRHLPNRHLRRSPVSIGTNVLFQYGGPGRKDEYLHDVGRITEVSGNVVSIRSKGKTYKVGASAVIPLHSYYQFTQEREPEVSSDKGLTQELGSASGGHVEEIDAEK